MSLETATPEVKQRRRFDISHAGVAGGVLAAILTLQPVKDFFWTREEGTALAQRVTAVELSVKELTKAVGDGQREATKQILDQMDRREMRVDQKFVSLETSFKDTLELLLRKDAINTMGNSKPRGK